MSMVHGGKFNTKITSNELKMLKTKALSTHPWNQANLGRVVTRIRHEFGSELSDSVSKALESVRSTKDTVSWHLAIDPLIEKVRNDEEMKKAAALSAALKKRELEKAEEEAARIVQARANVVVRRRSKDEAQEKNQTRNPKDIT